MESLICTDYNDFYKILASSTLTILSITWAIKIYIDRLRLDEIGKTEIKINKLTFLIYKFRNAVLDAQNLNLGRVYSTSKEEVYQKYIDAERKVANNEFLMFYNTLQFNIYENFMGDLNIYQEERLERNFFPEIWGYEDDANRKYKINTNNFKAWLIDVTEDLEEAQSAHNYLYRIIIDVKQNWWVHTENIYQENLKNFYEIYWDVLLKIRKDALKIKKEMDKKGEKWYMWNSNSKKVNRNLKHGIYLILYFGFILPLYMIQPIKIGIFSCEEVFWITLVALGFSVIFIYQAYRTRNSIY